MPHLFRLAQAWDSKKDNKGDRSDIDTIHLAHAPTVLHRNLVSYTHTEKIHSRTVSLDLHSSLTRKPIVIRRSYSRTFENDSEDEDLPIPLSTVESFQQA